MKKRFKFGEELVEIDTNKNIKERICVNCNLMGLSCDDKGPAGCFNCNLLNIECEEYMNINNEPSSIEEEKSEEMLSNEENIVSFYDNIFSKLSENDKIELNTNIPFLYKLNDFPSQPNYNINSQLLLGGKNEKIIFSSQNDLNQQMKDIQSNLRIHNRNVKSNNQNNKTRIEIKKEEEDIFQNIPSKIPHTQNFDSVYENVQKNKIKIEENSSYGDIDISNLDNININNFDIKNINPFDHINEPTDGNTNHNNPNINYKNNEQNNNYQDQNRNNIQYKDINTSNINNKYPSYTQSNLQKDLQYQRKTINNNKIKQENRSRITNIYFIQPQQIMLNLNEEKEEDEEEYDPLFNHKVNDLEKEKLRIKKKIERLRKSNASKIVKVDPIDSPNIESYLFPKIPSSFLPNIGIRAGSMYAVMSYPKNMPDTFYQPQNVQFEEISEVLALAFGYPPKQITVRKSTMITPDYSSKESESYAKNILKACQNNINYVRSITFRKNANGRIIVLDTYNVVYSENKKPFRFFSFVKSTNILQGDEIDDLSARFQLI